MLSNSLVPFGPTALSTRADRQAAREVSRARASGLALAAHEVSKVEVIESVTEAALLATTRLAQLEHLLVVQSPYAAGRLQLIVEASALGMGMVVQQAARRVL